MASQRRDDAAAWIFDYLRDDLVGYYESIFLVFDISGFVNQIAERAPFRRRRGSSIRSKSQSIPAAIRRRMGSRFRIIMRWAGNVSRRRGCGLAKVYVVIGWVGGEHEGAVSEEGSKATVYYDPGKPEEAVLIRGLEGRIFSSHFF